VFLDRDGVLNRAVVRDGRPYPPASISEVEVPPDVPAALEGLRACGLLLVAVTNQPDVARGAQTREGVEQIHHYLRDRLPLDAIFTCFHDDPDGCDCRKPKAGLLHQAARELAIDVERSFMVGDRDSDVGAGRAAGCLTFLLDAPYNERPRWPPDHRVKTLLEAAEQIATIIRSEDLKPC
jgi:D-glycero-D-manno-heptose 1,7-bisphosphate phosphatase